MRARRGGLCPLRYLYLHGEESHSGLEVRMPRTTVNLRFVVSTAKVCLSALLSNCVVPLLQYGSVRGCSRLITITRKMDALH